MAGAEMSSNMKAEPGGGEGRWLGRHYSPGQGKVYRWCGVGRGSLGMWAKRLKLGLFYIHLLEQRSGRAAS